MPYIGKEQAAGFRAFGTKLPQLFKNLTAPGPYPSADILLLIKAFAAEAGIPRKCSSPACRRGGICHATEIGDAGPPCANHWPEDLVRQANSVAEGLVIAWGLTGMRHDAFVRELDDDIARLDREIG